MFELIKAFVCKDAQQIEHSGYTITGGHWSELGVASTYWVKGQETGWMSIHMRRQVTRSQLI